MDTSAADRELERMKASEGPAVDTSAADRELERIQATQGPEVDTSKADKELERLTGQAPQAAEADPYAGIPDANRYVDTNPVLDAIGQPFNVGASFLYGVNQVPGRFTGLEKGLEYAGQALQKKRRTTTEDLRDSLDKVSMQDGIGLPIWKKLSTGREIHPIDETVKALSGEPSHLSDDLKEGVAELADTGRDFFLGAGADPLTWAAAGPVGALVDKAAGLGVPAMRGVGAGLEGMAGLKRAVPVMDETGQVVRMAQAPKYGVAASGIMKGIGESLSKSGTGTVKSAVMGGVLGAGAARSDSDGFDVLKDAVGGVAGGLAMAVAGPHAAQALDEIGWKAMDGAATWLKGDEFANYGQNAKLAAEGQTKVNSAMIDILQSYGKATADFEPSTVNATKNLMADLKTEMLQRRRQLLGDTPPTVQNLKLVNESTEAAYRSMVDDGTITQKLGEQTADVAQAYDSLVQHNARVVEKINKEIFNLPEGVWDEETGKGIAGIPFHVEDLRPKMAMSEADQTLNKILSKRGINPPSGPLKRADSLERMKTWDKLGNAPSYEIYAQQMALNWASKVEKNAMGFMAKYRAAPILDGGMRATFNAMTNVYDGMTGFLKYNLLFPSSSWIRNHFMENMKKSFMLNGLPGFMDAVTIGKFHEGLSNDLRQLSDGNFITPFKSKYGADLAKYQIVDTNFFHDTDEVLGGGAATYMYKPETLARLQDAQAIDDAMPKGLQTVAKVAKFAASPFKIVGDRIVIPIGRAVEGGARASTFIRTTDSFLNDAKTVTHFGADPSLLEKGMLGDVSKLEEIGLDTHALKTAAAKVTNDTFFNYKAVNTMEKSLAKRLYPFYTFFKNNLRLYVNSSLDPRSLSRLNAVQHLDDSKGAVPTKDEWDGLPIYAKSANPKVVSRDENGILVYISPNDTYNEAVKNITEFGHLDNRNPMIEKMHPFLKTGILEPVTGIDTFTGQPYNPNELKDNERYTFNRGYVNVAEKKGIDWIAEKLGISPEAMAPLERIAGVYGTKINEKGQPVSTDKVANDFDRMWQTLAPKPLLEQVMGGIGKTREPKAIAEGLYGEGTPKLTKEQLLYNTFGPGRYVRVTKAEMDYNRNNSPEGKRRQIEEKNKAAREGGE